MLVNSRVAFLSLPFLEATRFGFLILWKNCTHCTPVPTDLNVFAAKRTQNIKGVIVNLAGMHTTKPGA